MIENCPHCNANLIAGRIPQEYIDKGYYGPATTEPRYYYRTIGVDVRGVYDGVLYYICPDCNGRWHRFESGRLRDLAEPFVSAPVI